MEYLDGRVFTDVSLGSLPKAERTAWYRGLLAASRLARTEPAAGPT